MQITIRSLQAASLAGIALAACATPLDHPYVIDEGQVGAPGVRAMFVAPISAIRGAPEHLLPAVDRCFEELVSHLESCGIVVQTLPLAEYRQLLKKAVAQVRERFGPDVSDDSEEFSRLSYAQLGRELSVSPDAILVPQLLLRKARIVNSMTKWDGVRRSQMEGSWRFSGKVPAASLLVRVHDPAGARVFESFGGLDTVSRFNVGEGRVEFVDEPLSNREHLREGIAIALSPYLGPREQCR